MPKIIFGDFEKYVFYSFYLLSIKSRGLKLSQPVSVIFSFCQVHSPLVVRPLHYNGYWAGHWTPPASSREERWNKDYVEDVNLGQVRIPDLS